MAAAASSLNAEPEAFTVTRYRWRGTKIPIPWTAKSIETTA